MAVVMVMKARTPLLTSLLSSGALLLAASAASVAATPSTATPSTATPSTAAQTRLAAVAFTSPQQGYGLFNVNTGVGKTCRVDVARTSDGGSHFTRPAPADSWPCSVTAPVSSIAADGSGDVFAYGPVLRVSHDHGRTWATVKAKGPVLALSAEGRSVWAVTANCISPTPDKCQLLLLVSTNGGRSWHLASDQPAGAVISGADTRPAGAASLIRTSAENAYLLATPVLSAHGQPALWTTKDSGVSWRMHAVTCHLAATAALAVAPDGKLFVACAGEPGAGFQVKSIVASANGGRTWHPQGNCTSLSCRPLGAGYLGEIAAVSDRTVFLVGDRTPLLDSQNGGRTWHVDQPVIGDGGGGTYQIAFLGPHGIILGSDPADNELPAIWHSSDSGAHWQITHPVVS
jgi:photosystem II stability/assembly factor-like uncharacterized protein